MHVRPRWELLAHVRGDHRQMVRGLLMVATHTLVEVDYGRASRMQPRLLAADHYMVNHVVHGVLGSVVEAEVKWAWVTLAQEH